MREVGASRVASAGDVYRAYNDAENRQDHETMDSLLADDIEITVNGVTAISSAEGDAVAMAALFEAYPDYRREILGIVEERTKAAVRWRMVGTPAGKIRDQLGPLDLHGCSVVEVKEGKISRAWLYSADGPIGKILALAAEKGAG
ncbi:MAG: hypothetical protein GWP04_09015 [Gammaproteobacteria bacterium]|nr:hypothetical protein [Gammaproteobacteria bacterium]